MIRSRTLLTLMHRLAFVAVVLMVGAPLLSRALQAPFIQAQAMCTHAGASGEVMEALSLADLAQTMRDGGADTSGGSHDLPGHGGNDVACDYCVLAARLLPWLVVALWVLPLLRVRTPDFRVLPSAAVAALWPAHAPRGPPQLA